MFSSATTYDWSHEKVIDLTPELKVWQKSVRDITTVYRVRVTPMLRSLPFTTTATVRLLDLVLGVQVSCPNSVSAYDDLGTVYEHIEVGGAVAAQLRYVGKKSSREESKAIEWGEQAVASLMQMIAEDLCEALVMGSVKAGDPASGWANPIVDRTIKRWQSRHEPNPSMQWVDSDKWGPDYTFKKFTKHIDTKEASPVTPKRQLLPNQGAW